MTREEIIKALRKAEVEILTVRERLDIDEIGDDIDYADINNATNTALVAIMDAIGAAEHGRGCGM